MLSQQPDPTLRVAVAVALQRQRGGGFDRADQDQIRQPISSRCAVASLLSAYIL